MNHLYRFIRCISLIVLSMASAGLSAQGTYVCNEAFGKNTPQGWSVQPAFSAQAPSWRTERD